MMYAAWWPLCAVSRVKRPARGRPQRGEGKCDWGFELRCASRVPSPSCRLYTAMESRTRIFFMFGARDGEHLSIRMERPRSPRRPGRTAEYRKLEIHIAAYAQSVDSPKDPPYARHSPKALGRDGGAGATLTKTLTQVVRVERPSPSTLYQAPLPAPVDVVYTDCGRCRAEGLSEGLYRIIGITRAFLLRRASSKSPARADCRLWKCEYRNTR
jgi:hypothetical protein